MEDELKAPEVGRKLGELASAYVLASHKGENGNVFVLLLLPYSHQPFCSALLVSKSAWQNGHYFDDVNEALYDYMERT